MMAHGNVRSRGVFFPLRWSSHFPSLTFSVMIAPRSILLLQPNPPPLAIMFLTVFFHCLSFLCLYSLPQPAQIYRAALWLCKRHAGKEEGHGFYNCSSPMLTARAAKVTHSVWLSHVHGAQQRFVFITEHVTCTQTHTFNQPPTAFPDKVRQNDDTYRQNHKILQQTDMEIILFSVKFCLFPSFSFTNPSGLGVGKKGTGERKP